MSLRSPPYHRRGRPPGRRRRLRPLQFVAGQRDIGPLLLSSDPIGERAAIDVERQLLSVERICSEVADHSIDGRLVFRGSTLTTVVRGISWKIGSHQHGSHTTIGAEDDNALWICPE